MRRPLTRFHWRFDQLVIRSGASSQAGVTSRIIVVEKPRPNTTAVASCTHHSELAPPKLMAPSAKLTFIWMIIGNRPNIVVPVVSRIGRIRWAAVAMAASSGERPSSRRRLKVSIRMMLLFTTTPASATMPVPIIRILT